MEYVYFAQCKRYVKIGHSVNPMARLRLLKTGARHLFDTDRVRLLAVIEGSGDLELAMQDRFRHLQVNVKRPQFLSLALSSGRMEWFHARPELLEWITGLRAQHVPLASLPGPYQKAKSR